MNLLSRVCLIFGSFITGSSILQTLSKTQRLHHTPVERQQQQQQPFCIVLALSGGGAFGAVQMGVLDGLINTVAAPTTYDIVTGISAGGLNAGFLSYYTHASDALSQIYNIYANLTTSQIYTSDFFHILSTYAVYSTAPLQATLTGIVATQQQQQQSPAPITLVGSTNVNQQTLDIFQYNLANIPEKVQLLMATSAIPFVFPPQILNDDLYVDGGVISNEMIQQAVSAKDCAFYNFTFISASPVPSKSRFRRQCCYILFSKHHTLWCLLNKIQRYIKRKI